MEEDLESFFLNTKPVKMLVSLKYSRTPNYASAISSKVDATYSHTVKVLQKMEKANLVEFERKGRRKEVFLTEKGDSLADCFKDVLTDLEN